jgi:hypothetical protein
VPRLPVGHIERDYLRLGEISRYLDGCSHVYRPLAETLVATGMRISEARSSEKAAPGSQTRTQAGGAAHCVSCCNPPVDPVARETLVAIDAGDWDHVRLLLHPYLHFEDATTKLRGRNNVLGHLRAITPVAPPNEVELRDGQIYRWITRG